MTSFEETTLSYNYQYTADEIDSFLYGVAQHDLESTHIPCHDLDYVELVEAYRDCRRHKRNTDSQIIFEMNLERNLMSLYKDLVEGVYAIGPSICFVNAEYNIREVWAATFRDRIVQHLVYNRFSDHWINRFIRDSFACLPDRGTLDGAERLEQHIRQFTDNYNDTEHKYYLKLDLSNFFTSINKQVVWDRMEPRFTCNWVKSLTHMILFHDPTQDFISYSDEKAFESVEPRKRLVNANLGCGLALGNLTSQFFANVIMDILDKYVKHELRVKHYVRYVDDMVFLGNSTQELVELSHKVIDKLSELCLTVNPRKTIIQRIDRGITFVGHTITKHGRKVSNKTTKRIKSKIRNDISKVPVYLGYTKQFTNVDSFERWLLNRAAKSDPSGQIPMWVLMYMCKNQTDQNLTHKKQKAAKARKRQKAAKRTKKSEGSRGVEPA